jgi:4'-phosphopantetheinyl transferase
MIKVFFYELESQLVQKEVSVWVKERLYELVHQEFGLQITGEQIAAGPYGKPYIKNAEHVHYNISHTKGACVIALSDEPVGIDIEGRRKINLKVADKYFTEREKEYIYTGKCGKQENIAGIKEIEQRFLVCWTRKEAYMKWTGKGFAQGISNFDVIEGDDVEYYRTWQQENYIISIYSEQVKNLYRNGD